MKRSTTTLIIAGTAAALLSLGAVAYATSDGHGPWNMGNGDGMGRMSGQMSDQMSGRHMNGQGMNGEGMNGMHWTVPAATGGTLDNTERDVLLHMVEEEKLAHDVYVTLGGTSDLVQFDHIANSETQHEAALQTLISRYGLDDPTAGKDIGEFTDPAFATLYDQLVADGSASDAAALEVGQRIEQMDIDDLQARIAQVDNDDVVQVLQHLLLGSQHHLQAFTNAG